MTPTAALKTSALLLLLLGCSNDFEGLPREVLISKLPDHDSKTHMKALRALSKPQNTDFLLSHLANPDQTIRGCCVHALTLIGDPKAIRGISLLEHDQDPWVRRWVAFAMRQFNSFPEAKMVQERMKLDSDPSVRAEARGDWF